MSVKKPEENKSVWVWVDIDEVGREQMQNILLGYREKAVDYVLQIALDADHWNRINPNEEPIQILLDFTCDVELRKSRSVLAN